MARNSKSAVEAAAVAASAAASAAAFAAERPLLALPAELTIYTVGELRPQSLAWLAGSAGAEAAEEVAVDAAGVQLLVSLQSALSARHQALRLAAPSRTLAAACTALGLAALVGMAEPMEAAA